MKSLWITLAVTASMALAQEGGNSVLIRNADVYTGAGPVMEDTSILVQNGRIAGVGKDLSAPDGVRVIDAEGMRVYPGLIDSGTALGLEEINGVNMTVDTGEMGQFMPQLRAIVAVNPDSQHFPVSRVNGITSAVTYPRLGGGGNQVIAGQAALLHTDGWTWEEMSVNQGAAMYMIFPTLRVVPDNGRGGRGGGRGRGGDLPSTYTEAKRKYQQEIETIHEFFENARRYRLAKDGKAPDFEVDLKFEAMQPVLDGKMPLAVQATRQRAILDAVAFAEREKVKLVIVNPRELGEAAAVLKEKEIPVIFGPTLSLPLNNDDAYDAPFKLPAEAYEAGLKIAFGTFENQFVRNLPYNVAKAVAYGLPYEAAIEAITKNPAEIWGAGDQLGSIEEGKWADLVLTDGDILETTTEIRGVFIKGRESDLTNRQTELYQRYLNRP